MAYDSFWIYLILLLFPLCCMLPHLLRKHRRKSSKTYKKYPENKFEIFSNDVKNNHVQNSLKPKSKDMIVLGELIRGVKKFETLQNITKLEHNELVSILDDLTNRSLVMTKQKNGFFGSTIELLVTENGFNEYNK